GVEEVVLDEASDARRVVGDRVVAVRHLARAGEDAETELEVVVEEVALQLEAGVAAAAGVGHERAGERGVDAEARRARAEDVARERDEHEAGGEEELVAVDPDLAEEVLDDRAGAELVDDRRHRRAALHGLADARRVEDDVDEEVLEEGRGGDESGAA